MTIEPPPGKPSVAPTAPRSGSLAANGSGTAFRSGTHRSATSRSGSKRTARASRSWFRGPATLSPRVPAPATTCALVTTYPGATANPVPTDWRPQVAAATLKVLFSASAAIARARGSAGRSTGGAGNGSKPTNTSGRPVWSSQPPSPTATSVAGGRIVAIVRTAVELLAVSASRG